MFDEVYSLEQAQDWFLSHSEGEVKCHRTDEKNGVTDIKICGTFFAAKEFYEEIKMPVASMCKECGYTIIDGVHGTGINTLAALEKELDWYIRLECCSCKANVSMKTVKEQGLHKWYFISGTGSFLCAGCAHQIGLY